MNYKRYFVYAKRKGEEWSNWSQFDYLEDAIKQSEIIKGNGWYARIWDHLKKKAVETNG